MSHNQKHSQKPRVDIITPVYGGPDFLEGLAETLLEKYDAGELFQWIIIDDATPEDRDRAEVIRLLRELDKRENVTTIQNQINGGFSKSNNLAAPKGRAPYLLLLNSDIRIGSDGWLRQLTHHLDENPALGIVGARLLYFEDSKESDRPAGCVQHAGVGFNLLGHPYHIFMGWPADHPKVMERRLMQAVTGACLLTRRSVWRRIGGLQEVYGTGNFEDVEYCIRSFRMGHMVLYEPDVVVYHYGSGSDNTPTINRNYKIFDLRNHELLMWDDWRYY